MKARKLKKYTYKKIGTLEDRWYMISIIIRFKRRLTDGDVPNLSQYTKDNQNDYMAFFDTFYEPIVLKHKRIVDVGSWHTNEDQLCETSEGFQMNLFADKLQNQLFILNRDGGEILRQLRKFDFITVDAHLCYEHLHDEHPMILKDI